MERSEEGRREFRTRLERRRGRLLSRLRDMRRQGFADAETGGIGELSLYDQHPADLGAELNARQTDLGLRRNIERTLEQIEKALQRIERGDYGTCENCRRPIERDRLEALPYVPLCVACQREAEEREGAASPRPPEEAALEPPFGRTFRDGGDGTAYDGEDAWQDVARYGTSETPQDVPPAVGYDETHVDADEPRGAVEAVDEVEDAGGEGVQIPDVYPTPKGKGPKGLRRRRPT